MFKRTKIIRSTLLIIALLLVSVVLRTNTAHAEGGGSVEALRNKNIFYAYVASGENLDTEFIRINSPSVDPDQQTDARIIISRPGAADTTCTIAAAATNGADCTSTNLTASTSGIWKIEFDVDKEVPTNHSWEINVQTGSTDIPGRVWSISYWFSQAIGGQNANPPDLSFWYQSEQGYLYRADYKEYYGIDSIFQASAFGIVSPNTCNTIYKSITTGGSVGNASESQIINDPNGNCGGLYKVFFANPDASLPASAPTWDGGSQWLKPSVSAPVINSLTFASNNNTASGAVTVATGNYIGGAELQIDVDSNGSYGDSVDRAVPVHITSNTTTYQFDGKDGLGNTIANTQKLTFQLRLAKAGEIHFVNTDAEKRAGGIEVNRLNGAAAGRTIVYWNDTDFIPYNSQRCSTTSNQNGTAGIDSTGGVHSWDNEGCGNSGNDNNDEPDNTGSYGDARHIHDWTYAPSPIITAQYVYLPDVYVECTAMIGDPCTVEIPEFCQPDLLTDPREGSSVVEDGQVTYTPNGNVSEEENYVHLRDDSDTTAKCFVKIKFIPKGTNTGVNNSSGGMYLTGAAGIGALGLITKKYGISKVLRTIFRR